MRILAVSHTWQGATDYGFVRAFRRRDLSVTVASETDFYPVGWHHPLLRVLRRLALPVTIADYQRSLISAARRLSPQLFFVFKGTFVERETIDAIRNMGATAINVYPDVSFTVHGPIIPKALPRYDWVFTTKSYGLADLARELKVERASFLPHCFDPECHRPVEMDGEDRARYGCDAVFVGTWSPKKEMLLAALRRAQPNTNLKIWGNQWDRVSKGSPIADSITGQPVNGREYAKAISAASVNLAILSEVRGEATSGDLTTTRSFQIPAVGGFMLHERTTEAQGYFAEGTECAMFEGADELAAKVGYYLAHAEERRRIAEAGHRRCLTSSYSVDDRVTTILAKVADIRATPRT